MNLENRVNNTNTSINQTSVSKKNGHNVGALSKYGETVPLKQISVNQVIRGEVTDLRNNEITVTLNDNTTITGKLSNGSMLSIGDTAAFKISSVQPYIELEALIQSATVIENATIQKALESAGLPKTEKNQLVVHELMNNNMPINKQSIQNILQQAYQFKNAQISTLVIMSRNNIPFLEETVTQFEAYRNMEHQIVDKVNAFSESIPSLLQILSERSPASAVSAFGNQLLGILLPENSLKGMANEPTISNLSTKDLETLQTILDTQALSEDQKAGIQNGTSSLRDVVHLLNQGMELAYEFDKNNLKAMMDEKISKANQADIAPIMKQIESELTQIPKALDSFDEPVIKELFSKFSEMQYQNNELGSILNRENRQNLINQLEGFSISNKEIQRMLSGEISLSDTLKLIKAAIPSTPEHAVIRLFDSEAFKAMLKSHITSNWTLKPKDLENDGAVDSLYQKMYDQSKELDSFFKTTLGNTDIGSSLSRQASDMRQNMDFMQTLNQMFSYVQIPLKLKEQTVHSELYVYTKKQSMREHPENISVLLHLDMEKLGPLDIFVALKENDVNAKFYLPDKFAKSLFKDNIAELNEALQQKGYSISTEFLMQERNVDIVEDFIDMDLPNNELKRYTFDIRA